MSSESHYNKPVLCHETWGNGGEKESAGDR